MKCIILSDSHGDYESLISVLRQNRDAEVVFFLGDGLSEVRELLSAAGSPPLYAVRGNCDIGRMGEDELVVALGSHRILMLHGHTAAVKGGDAGLLALARHYGADILLYGHTHLRREEYLPPDEGGPLWLFNPGSVGRPPNGIPSFGRLSVSDSDGLLFGFGDITEDKA